MSFGGQILNRIEESIAKAKFVPRFQFEMAIILKTTHELIGGAHIERETQDSRVGNIGYAINPRFQNQGYATEISKALIEFGFKNLELLVIYATCDTRNIASFSVLQKCGMKKVGKMIGDRKIRGAIYDSFRYEIYATDRCWHDY